MLAPGEAVMQLGLHLCTAPRGRSGGRQGAQRARSAIVLDSTREIYRSGVVFARFSPGAGEQLVRQVWCLDVALWRHRSKSPHPSSRRIDRRYSRHCGTCKLSKPHALPPEACRYADTIGPLRFYLAVQPRRRNLSRVSAPATPTTLPKIADIDDVVCARYSADRGAGV